jgi:hypothetical protein
MLLLVHTSAFGIATALVLDGMPTHSTTASVRPRWDSMRRRSRVSAL